VQFWETVCSDLSMGVKPCSLQQSCKHARVNEQTYHLRYMLGLSESYISVCGVYMVFPAGTITKQSLIYIRCMFTDLSSPRYAAKKAGAVCMGAVCIGAVCRSCL